MFSVAVIVFATIIVSVYIGTYISFRICKVDRDMALWASIVIPKRYLALIINPGRLIRDMNKSNKKIPLMDYVKLRIYLTANYAEALYYIGIELYKVQVQELRTTARKEFDVRTACKTINTSCDKSVHSSIILYNNTSTAA